MQRCCLHQHCSVTTSGGICSSLPSRPDRLRRRDVRLFQQQGQTSAWMYLSGCWPGRMPSLTLKPTLTLLQDIGPRYSGVLLGMSNTAGVLAGVFGTAATGYILKNGSWDEVPSPKRSSYCVLRSQSRCQPHLRFLRFVSEAQWDLS